MNQHPRHRAEDVLRAKTHAPNKTATSFIEDVLRLSARVAPQATEQKILRVLMRGVKSDIFGGLFRNSPTTVDGFVADATNIERVLKTRARPYHRINDVSTLKSERSEIRTSADKLRDIIRGVVRKELKKLLHAADPPRSLSVAKVVREELKKAIELRAPGNLRRSSNRRYSQLSGCRRRS